MMCGGSIPTHPCGVSGSSSAVSVGKHIGGLSILLLVLLALLVLLMLVLLAAGCMCAPAAETANVYLSHRLPMSRTQN